MYTGDVAQAVSFLESSVVESPARAGVNETLIFNLVTMYDLGEGSLGKKSKLLAGVVAKYTGDAFEAESLKL
ncbi:MAG: hypothetical protein SGCHY_002430 [Lobulomycetales sp.]